MARLYPPVPLSSLPKNEFEFVIALEQYLDDDYLVIQAASLGPVNNPIDPETIIVIHATMGIYSILFPSDNELVDYAKAFYGKSAFLNALQFDLPALNPDMALCKLSSALAGAFLGIAPEKIGGLVFRKAVADNDSAHMISGTGYEIADRLDTLFSRRQLGPMRPTIEEYSGMIDRHFMETRINRNKIDPKQANYRLCRNELQSALSERRNRF